MMIAARRDRGICLSSEDLSRRRKIVDLVFALAKQAARIRNFGRMRDASVVEAPEAIGFPDDLRPLRELLIVILADWLMMLNRNLTL